jgi:hypothetical protein
MNESKSAGLFSIQPGRNLQVTGSLSGFVLAYRLEREDWIYEGWNGVSLRAVLNDIAL